MSYQVGDTYTTAIEVRDEDGALIDPASILLTVRTAAGTNLPLATAAALVDHDATGRYHADVPLTLAGMWVIGWNASDPDQFGAVHVWVSPALLPLFCSPADVATRLGRGSGGLTADETPQVEMLCELATTTIVDALSKDDVWRAAVTVIPPIVRVVAIELVARGMANPSGLSSVTESLGAYSYTQRYSTRDTSSAAGLYLTKTEERLVRRAVFGTLTATTVPHTLTFDPDPDEVSAI